MDSGLIKALELPAKITGGIFVASVLIWLFDGSDTLNLDDFGPWARSLSIIVLTLSGCLFASAIIQKSWEATESYRTARQRKKKHRKLVNDFSAQIPYLNEKEKIILGYLRHNNQKRFTGADDAGHARTLLSKGYVRYIAFQGQVVSARDVPFEVSEHVWEVVEARPEDFPHNPEFSNRDNKVEVHPWRERLW